MNLWKDRRVDSLHRVVLPREAFSLLGWTSDEVLEAEALPAQDALLLRAQNHPRPQCCACGGAQGLVSLGGRRWLCGACLAAANAAAKSAPPVLGVLAQENIILEAGISAHSFVKSP